MAASSLLLILYPLTISRRRRGFCCQSREWEGVCDIPAACERPEEATNASIQLSLLWNDDPVSLESEERTLNLRLMP